jgi:hypothetical protein
MMPAMIMETNMTINTLDTLGALGMDGNLILLPSGAGSNMSYHPVPS